ncbi:MAG: hypothetical protein HY235_15030 [Acidobacteria bacterium]|nr:hypothetical protein [Acidobacteriota bacterium]
MKDAAIEVWREKLRSFLKAGVDGQPAPPPEAVLYPVKALLAWGARHHRLPADAPSLAVFYGGMLAAARKPARERLLEDLTRLSGKLRDLLAAEDSHSPEAASPEAVSASLGMEAEVFFDAAALSEALSHSTRGPLRMRPDRRRRIEATLAALEEYSREMRMAPAFWLFGAGESAAGIEAVGGRPSPHAGVLGFCEGLRDRLSGLLRAVRTARLEVENAFDPARHQERLEQLDWRSATRDELVSLPAAVVVETPERLSQESVGAFGRLLRSGYPVQILIRQQGEDLSGLRPDFGSLAVAHREVFVLQSSLACPDHLSQGLARMSETPRPAVAVISAPAQAESKSLAWQRTLLLYLSRAFPLYCYDPDRGQTWASRFQLHEERPEEALTPADAAALFPEFRCHFRVIPESAWKDEQVELCEYLAPREDAPTPRAVPFVWVADSEGRPERAIVSREMVRYCLDRLRAWTLLEELAGIRNEQAEAAVAQVRKEIEEAATNREQAAIEKAKREGASEAIRRVVAVLTGPELVKRPAKAAALAGQEPAPAPQQIAAEPAPASEAPYIDSFLCTSCNDCFKINARMFQYDANKQAYLADRSAGTFAELVKAAEVCPAKCIHPGNPRPADTTATPAMLARAAKLK